MVRPGLLLILLTFYIARIQAESVWNALVKSTENIDKFRKLIEDTSQRSYLEGTLCSSSSCYSVFIPTNEALDRAYPDNGTNSLPNEEKKNLVNVHIAKLVNIRKVTIIVSKTAFDNNDVLKQGDEINFGSSVTMGLYISGLYSPQGTSLYWTRKINGSETTYYVNNAREKANSEQVLDNGSFHVIEDVIKPIPKTETVFDVIKNDPNYSEFLKIYNAFRASDISALVKSDITSKFEATSTAASDSSFFIPDNNGISKIPTTVLDALKANSTRLTEFVVSHTASSQLVFMSWMRNMPPINLNMQSIEAKLTFPAKMYSENNGTSNYISCGGVTAMIYTEGQPLKQAIMFRISQPLNFLYTDVTSILQQKSSTFATACLGNSKCKSILQSGNVTVFAPLNAALPNLNATHLEQWLLLHLIPNKHISTPEMLLGRMETIPDAGHVRFRPENNNQMFVSGRLLFKVGTNGYDQGFVGGRVTEPNLSGTGGVVHVIDQPLGIATMSIYQLLENKFTSFSVLLGYLNEFDLTQSLKEVPPNGQHYTFFAPTNAAFAKMTDNLGQKILADKNLRNQLLKRLLLLNVVVMSSLKLDTKYSAVTALPYSNQPSDHAKLTIETSINREKQHLMIGISESYVTDDAATVSFLPIDSEWGCSNGIVYALDTVPYNAKSTERVCKPGTTCGSYQLLSNGLWILLLTFGTAMLLQLE